MVHIYKSPQGEAEPYGSEVVHGVVIFVSEGEIMRRYVLAYCGVGEVSQIV
jgi:hypothetical protein